MTEERGMGWQNMQEHIGAKRERKNCCARKNRKRKDRNVRKKI
jgi:hypothetical protein